MKSLKIWYVIDIYNGPNGGTEKQLLKLIKGMIESGHKVRLLVLRNSDYTLSASGFPCSIDSVNIYRVLSLQTIRNMFKFRAKIRHEQPDIVHAFFNDSAAIIPLLVNNNKHTKIFTSRRDMGFWYTFSRLLLLRIANIFVDGVICNSTAVARVTHDKEWIPWRKLFVVYNCVTAIEGSDCNYENTTDFLPLENAINICIVANLRPIKRIEDLIKAAEMVVANFPNCYFWIIGASLMENYSNSLKEMVKELNLEKSVRFLGKIKNAAQIMRHCDIGVLTSESEGLSNSLLEYMAEGLAIVCSDADGNTELIKHDEGGFVYPCGDVRMLADHLIKLCADPKLRTRMSEAAKARANHFSLESMLESYLQVYVDSPTTLLTVSPS